MKSYSWFYFAILEKRGKTKQGRANKLKRQEQLARIAGTAAAAAAPEPAPGGLEGQQQVEVEAAGPAAAAMEVVVDGAAADFEREAQAPEPGN